MNLRETRNDPPSNSKTTVVAMLNARLADAIDLSLATKQAHWNLRGPQFIAVHEMLDGFRGELDTHVDTMAERIVQIGGVALGSTQAVAGATALDAYPDAYPVDIVAVQEHLTALADRYGKTANAVRAGIETADDAGDAAAPTF